jgi:hypothetical protein
VPKTGFHALQKVVFGFWFWSGKQIEKQQHLKKNMNLPDYVNRTRTRPPARVLVVLVILKSYRQVMPRFKSFDGKDL